MLSPESEAPPSSPSANAVVPLRMALRLLAGYCGVQLIVGICVAFVFLTPGGNSQDRVQGLADADLAIRVARCLGMYLAVAYVLQAAWTQILADSSGSLRSRIGATFAPRRFLVQGALLGVVCLIYPLGRDLVLPEEAVHDPTLFQGFTGALEALGAVFWVPVGEELLFRGFLLSAIRDRAGFGTAATATTALFVLMHLDQLYWWPDGAVVLSALSAVSFGLLRTSGSLAPGVLAHAVYNLGIVLQASL